MRALYDDSRCILPFARRAWQGFLLGAGIRQGCPLYPLLFSVVLDPFLRDLRTVVPTATLRAYADDIGMVIRQISVDLPLQHARFVEFAECPVWC